MPTSSAVSSKYADGVHFGGFLIKIDENNTRLIDKPLTQVPQFMFFIDLFLLKWVLIVVFKVTWSSNLALIMQATITRCPFELLCSYYCSILVLYISFTIINPMLIRSSSSIVTRTSLQICKPDSKPELSNECNVSRSRKQRETLVGFRTNVWQVSTYYEPVH